MATFALKRKKNLNAHQFGEHLATMANGYSENKTQMIIYKEVMMSLPPYPPKPPIPSETERCDTCNDPRIEYKDGVKLCWVCHTVNRIEDKHA